MASVYLVKFLAQGRTQKGLLLAEPKQQMEGEQIQLI